VVKNAKSVCTIFAMKPRILVVEDEPSISEPLAEDLARERFEHQVASTLESAREALRDTMPDLILLDVMLPDGDGRDLARDIRRGSDASIIMLTARGEETDRVVGLDSGRTTTSGGGDDNSGPGGGDDHDDD
jgi:DNA-binding response OmpR family regulator